MAGSLKFWIKEVGGLYIYVGKTKAQITWAVTAQLICDFVFAYAKRRFSRDAAHICSVFLQALCGVGQCLRALSTHKNPDPPVQWIVQEMV